jgi:hypothetical protein
MAESILQSLTEELIDLACAFHTTDRKEAYDAQTEDRTQAQIDDCDHEGGL